MITLNHDDNDRPGGRSWVLTRLDAMASAARWTETPACAELIAWLYRVAAHRARTRGLRGSELDDVVQDSMLRIVQALSRSGEISSRADNPAALLECAVTRAVSEACVAHRRCGFGGLTASNDFQLPKRVSATCLGVELEQLALDHRPLTGKVDELVRQVVTWCRAKLGLALGTATVDAVTYAIDRLVSGSGISRRTLVTGGHSRLRVDPAMHYLGFSPATASAFALWLLGRSDDAGRPIGVLDAVLDEPADAALVARWRRDAVRHEFGAPVGSQTERLTA